MWTYVLAIKKSSSVVQKLWQCYSHALYYEQWAILCWQSYILDYILILCVLWWWHKIFLSCPNVSSVSVHCCAGSAGSCCLYCSCSLFSLSPAPLHLSCLDTQLKAGYLTTLVSGVKKLPCTACIIWAVSFSCWQTYLTNICSNSLFSGLNKMTDYCKSTN